MIYRRKNWPTIKAAFRGFDLETGAAPARRIAQSQSRFLCFSFPRPRARARSHNETRLGAVNVALLITSAIIIILYHGVVGGRARAAVNGE